jgi:hypothetical protein
VGNLQHRGIEFDQRWTANPRAGVAGDSHFSGGSFEAVAGRRVGPELQLGRGRCLMFLLFDGMIASQRSVQKEVCVIYDREWV